MLANIIIRLSAVIAYRLSALHLLIVLGCTVAPKPQRGKGDGWSYRAQPHTDRTPGLGF